MLTIRRAQIAVFEDVHWRDFVNRVAAAVREKFPQAAGSLGPGVLIASVEQALSRGRQYGLEGEHDLSRYAHLYFELGSNFDRSGKYPWATEVLGSTVFSPHTKIDLLTQLANPAPPEPPLEYDEPDDPSAAEEETPDEERMALDEEAEDFEPESEDPGELPEDEILDTGEEDVIPVPAEVVEED